MAPKKKITLKIPSDISCVGRTSGEIIEFVKPYGLTETDIFNVRLSVEEALRNAIEHGNKSNKALPVEVEYCVRDNKLEVTVEDKGNGFDFKKLPDPTEGENMLRESGRGIFLIKRLMDEVTFNRKGNRIVMKKNFNKGRI